MKKFCVYALYHKVMTTFCTLFLLCLGNDRFGRSLSRPRPFFTFPLI